MKDPNDLLTLQQLSDESQIPVKSLYAICYPAGDLPVVRRTLGASAKRRTRGRIHVKRADWDAWVTAHTTAPTSPTQMIPRGSVMDLPGADRYLN